MKPVSLAPDAYLPLRELAQYSGLSVRTLRGRLQDPVGPLPHFRIGAKIPVKRSDFDAWALRFRQVKPATLDQMVEDVIKELRQSMGVKARFHKGAWWVFINHRGRRKAKKVGDRTSAEVLAKTLRERLARADLQFATTDTATLRAYAESWLNTAEANLKASPVTFYRGCLEQHILPALGSRPVSSLRRLDCRDLVTTCRAKGLKVTTVRGIARTLSTILSHAVEDEVLPANPALRLGRYLRTADEPEPEIDPFTRVVSVPACVRANCWPSSGAI